MFERNRKKKVIVNLRAVIMNTPDSELDHTAEYINEIQLFLDRLEENGIESPIMKNTRLVEKYGLDIGSLQTVKSAFADRMKVF